MALVFLALLSLLPVSCGPASKRVLEASSRFEAGLESPRLGATHCGLIASTP